MKLFKIYEYFRNVPLSCFLGELCSLLSCDEGMGAGTGVQLTPVPGKHDSTVQCTEYSIVQYSTVQYSIVQYNTV